MTKFRWKESMNMFRNHMDPEKEEQLKWITIGNYFSPKQRSFEYCWRLWDSTFDLKRVDFKALSSPSRTFSQRGGFLWYAQDRRLRQMDTKVKRILKLIKNINYGNREANLKKRAEFIQLIEDLHKQYQSLYALYDDLKEGVKRKCNNEDEHEDGGSSSSSSSSAASLESASYYSPGSESKTPRHDLLKTAAPTDDKSEVVKEALSFEPVSSSYSVELEIEEGEDGDDEDGETVEKLMKEAMDEREKKFQNLEKKSSGKIKELEDRVIELQLEIEALNYQKREVEEVRKENSGLRGRVSELEVIFKEKEDKVFDVMKKLEENEKVFKGEIDESMNKVRNLQTEVNSLRFQKDEAQDRFSHELQKELESLRIQKTETETKLENKAKEVYDSLVMLENLKEKLKQKTRDEERLVEERNDLQRQGNDLKMAIISINDEAHVLKSKNEEQRTTISQIEAKLKEKDDQIDTLETKIEGIKKDMSNFKQKCNLLELDKRELEQKNDILATSLEEREVLVNKLNQDTKSSFRTTERKMEEMVEEFRKKSEDSIRILSRRIRVAEQLHVENKEWYKKTKDQYEQDQRDHENAFRNIKLVTEMVSNTLSESETSGLRFAECSEHFMNRISKASCELNFAKDWVKRKNGAIAHVKEDLDTLLVQLDDKEEEILGSRQKVWKLENKVRELEKIVKENEEGMIVLQEEKREAIRQLCVWIDYHRGRSDFLKKACSDLLARINPTST